jgi:hypothetical protein
MIGLALFALVGFLIWACNEKDRQFQRMLQTADDRAGRAAQAELNLWRQLDDLFEQHPGCKREWILTPRADGKGFDAVMKISCPDQATADEVNRLKRQAAEAAAPSPAVRRFNERMKDTN